MSNFKVSPVVDADFDRMLTYTDENGGTLAAPLLFSVWSATTPEDVARRNAWSMKQQRWQLHNDSTVHFMKVEDTSTGDIVSLSRWHRYPAGYPQEDVQTEIDVFTQAGSPTEPIEGFRQDIMKDWLTDLCRLRGSYVGPGLSWGKSHE
jgi:hypothetical protein